MAEVAAGFVTLPGGMDAKSSALTLQDTQCARAINVTFRNGSPTTRPAFIPIGPAAPVVGKFRGMGRWSLTREDYLPMVLGSDVVVFAADTEDYVASFPGCLNTAETPCYFTQVHKYLVVQDGESAPLVLQESGGVISQVEVTEVPKDDGSEETRPLPGIPPGTLGVFAHGRYHLVPTLIPNTDESGLTSLLSGDIMLPEDPKTVLGFSETEYLNEGGAHALPLELGRIGGLGVLRSPSGTGHGQVVVFGRTGSCAFDFAKPREGWKDGPISSVLFQGPGCRSPRSVINVNSDLVYRGADGLRTLRYTAQQQTGSLLDAPISRAVGTWLESDSLYLPEVSAAYHDNQVLTTTQARAFGGDAFGGLVSWDVLNGSVYDGVWTGGAFQQVSVATWQGDPSFFVFCERQMYRVARTEVQDDPGDSAIRARIETKSFSFENLISIKQLQYVEVWFSEVSRSTEVKVWFRPHGYPLWFPLGTREVLLQAGSLPRAASQLRFSVDFAKVPCDPASGDALYAAQAFQFAIQWTGRATLERFRAVAEQRTGAPTDPCDSGVEPIIQTELGLGEALYDFDYLWGETP